MKDIEADINATGNLINKVRYSPSRLPILVNTHSFWILVSPTFPGIEVFPVGAIRHPVQSSRRWPSGMFKACQMMFPPLKDSCASSLGKVTFNLLVQFTPL